MSGTGQQAEKMCDRHRALSFWQLYWLATPNKDGLKQLSEDNWIDLNESIIVAAVEAVNWEERSD